MASTPFRCSQCGNETWKLISHPEVDFIGCSLCINEALWKSDHPRTAAPMFSLGAHPSERTVIWENPKTKEVRYPGQNTAVMPDRYRQQGFERKELPTLRSIEQFEKAHGVKSEIAHFDKGSGRGFDD